MAMCFRALKGPYSCHMTGILVHIRKFSKISTRIVRSKLYSSSNSDYIAFICWFKEMNISVTLTLGTVR